MLTPWLPYAYPMPTPCSPSIAQGYVVAGGPAATLVPLLLLVDLVQKLNNLTPNCL